MYGDETELKGVESCRRFRVFGFRVFPKPPM